MISSIRRCIYNDEDDVIDAVIVINFCGVEKAYAGFSKQLGDYPRGCFYQIHT